RIAIAGRGVPAAAAWLRTTGGLPVGGSVLRPEPVCGAVHVLSVHGGEEHDRLRGGVLAAAVGVDRAGLDVLGLHRIPFVDTPAFRPGRKRSSRVAGQEKANRRQGDSASTATGRHPPLTRKLIECEA